MHLFLHFSTPDNELRLEHLTQSLRSLTHIKQRDHAVEQVTHRHASEFHPAEDDARPSVIRQRRILHGCDLFATL